MVKNYLLFSHTLLRKTEFIIVQTKKPYNIIVNSMSAEAGVLTLGRAQNNHIVLMYDFFFKIVFFTSVDIK